MVFVEKRFDKRSRQVMKRAIVIILFGVFLFGGCAEKEYRSSKIRIQHPKWDDSTIRKVEKERWNLG